MDDELLAKLDADEEVQREGRSAVLRRAVEVYLRTRRREAIAQQYAQAYGTSEPNADFSGWEDEGVWPDQ